MRRYVFSGLLLVFSFTGCNLPSPAVSNHEVEALTQQLQSLDSHISHTEALTLSQEIFRTTTQLRQRFERTTPPLIHNFLVNVGIKEKGLCYHWSDALYLHLTKKHYPSYAFHLVGANIGEYFFEHNALVVIAKKGKIEQGVLIDPWRDRGRLYFSKLDQDSAYEWHHRPKRGCH